MAVFILGPSEWRVPQARPTPFTIRKRLAKICRLHGEHPIIMEEVDDLPGEGLAEKFLRILDTLDIHTIMVVWPLAGKMPTTIAELVALRFRRAQRPVPAIWLLLERGVATPADGVLHIGVSEGRVAYLRDLTRSGTELLQWQGTDDLYGKAERLIRAGFDP